MKKTNTKIKRCESLCDIALSRRNKGNNYVPCHSYYRVLRICQKLRKIDRDAIQEKSNKINLSK